MRRCLLLLTAAAVLACCTASRDPNRRPDTDAGQGAAAGSSGTDVPDGGQGGAAGTYLCGHTLRCRIDQSCHSSDYPITYSCSDIPEECLGAQDVCACMGWPAQGTCFCFLNEEGYVRTECI
jgi:hypothetical protein